MRSHRTSTSSALSFTAGCVTTKTASACSKSDDFCPLHRRDFAFYGRWYERLRQAAERADAGLERVHFNAQHNFTLQYPVLLVATASTGRRQTIIRKIRVWRHTSTF